MEFTQIKDIFSSIRFEKTKRLVSEFRLKAPSFKTFQVVEKLLKKGSFPLIKTMNLDAAEYLFGQGELRPAKEMGDDEGFEGIYTSLVVAKSYGPIAIVLNPDVLLRKEFIAYAVDHATYYVQNQITTEMTEEDILQKYRLNSDEFFEFYAYCVASLTDHPISEYSQQESEILKFIVFDITLPIINRCDAQQVFIIEDQIYDEELIAQLKRIIAKMNGIRFTIINSPSKTSRNSQPYPLASSSSAILAHLENEFNIPPKLIQACISVA